MTPSDADLVKLCDHIDRSKSIWGAVGFITIDDLKALSVFARSRLSSPLPQEIEEIGAQIEQDEKIVRMSPAYFEQYREYCRKFLSFIRSQPTQAGVTAKEAEDIVEAAFGGWEKPDKVEAAARVKKFLSTKPVPVEEAQKGLTEEPARYRCVECKRVFCEEGMDWDNYLKTYRCPIDGMSCVKIDRLTAKGGSDV